MTLAIYVGHDRREPEATEVCIKSLLRRSSQPLHIITLSLPELCHAGFHSRGVKTRNGQRYDTKDGKPFSTDFSFSRFLVPALSLYQGWALFCDSDFLFTADIAGLFELADERYAVMCVKHNHDPEEKVKMDGMVQTRYFRKNWSSLVLWNCSHPANQAITRECVNKQPGAWLHAFSWLKDEQIGELPLTWNWLSGVSAPASDDPNYVPCGIHFTLGIPSMEGHENDPFADLWRVEKHSYRVPCMRPNPTEYERARAA